jgi:hypothetical protein
MQGMREHELPRKKGKGEAGRSGGKFPLLPDFASMTALPATAKLSGLLCGYRLNNL